ncbi:MOSC domain-containing protein [Haloactinomyces albus]|uniref:MOSC domain-containing protein YiiM n=1 Tax=Haloactinomyces albus TaxID=1352928 RepID=A0AAE4CL31_9ACTN|nr:MOSC domain-containing protein [Haloactinomyces albus]MDR7300941.1 MOSC domain-containing protein YiiM [Haloactinomyces albus]
MGYVESVNVAMVRTGDWTGRVGRTGIDKRPVDGPLLLDGTGAHGDDGSGARGDTVADADHHGGRHQALYAFDVEDLRSWSTELGKELASGNAGENLTLSGCDSSRAVIGQRWRIGTAVLRVTGPRIPCRVFAGFWDIPDLVKRFTARGRPGAYLAVEEQGEIRARDRVEVLSSPEHGVTVADYFAFRAQGRRDLAEHIAGGLSDLPDKLAEHVVPALNGR